MFLHHLKKWCPHRKFSSILLVILLSCMAIYLWPKHSSSPIKQDHSKVIIEKVGISTTAPVAVSSEVLLLYVYAKTHTHAYGNLEYFVKTAVGEEDGVDYYFIIQQVDKRVVKEDELPPLKAKNAHYIQHENKCFDFGTYGWFLNEYTYGNPWLNQTSPSDKKIDIKKYKYFIFMNSSIRGPFLTPYFLESLSQINPRYYWYSIFTQRINEHVKLVGCTISCETTPHVQTYIFATDFVGLSLLLKPGQWGATLEEGLFGCYPTKDHASLYSEMPTSNRILDSGYAIDSLLTKYQNINFSVPHNRDCNRNQNPYKDKNLDNISLEPYEVVFVKFNDLEFLKDPKDRAKLYQRWSEDTNNPNRSSW